MTIRVVKTSFRYDVALEARAFPALTIVPARQILQVGIKDQLLWPRSFPDLWALCKTRSQ
jgi:hypothetical protein